MITVYIDVLFMVNFVINILIVEGTGVLVAESVKWYRTLCAAFVGAVYSVAVFFPDFQFAATLVMKIILSGVMVLCAFKIKSGRHLLKLWGSFYLVSFIFGGGIVAVLSLTGLGAKMGAVYSNGTVYFNLPWSVLGIGCGAIYFLIYTFGRYRRRKINKEAAKRQLSIYIKDVMIETDAIIDTGNSLFDPITGDPVIVCEYEEIKPYLPVCESVTESLMQAGLKIRLIPFTSVGTENGLMPAFCPDKVKIDKCEAGRCIVGVSETKVSKNADYHALLNPMLALK